MDKNLKAAVLAVAGLAAAGAATAQTPPNRPSSGVPAMSAPAASPVFTIRGFKVTGDNPLDSGETARILAPFLRANATIETLQQATAALEAELRRRGFGLHRVALPPQEVGDTVTLNIVTFVVDKVTIEGRQVYSEANIRRSLPELQERRTPNFRRLAVQTAIANENPNKQIQVGIRESDEPDKINANIQVKEQRPWTLAMSLSNAGTAASGHDRFTISGGHTNLFDADHQFTAAYTTSFEKMDDVKQLGLSYRVPLYLQGGVIGASYTRSDVVGNFGAFSSTGAGHTFGVNYTHYLEPEGGRRSYVTAGFDDKVFNAAKINDVVVPGTLDRRSRPISLGYTARTESDTAVWGYSVDFAWNTGSGSGNDLVAYQSEDPRIDTVHWKAIHGGFNYLAPVGSAPNPWTWGTRLAYQYSPDVLLSGEQFGLGGLSSVRGTSIDRPISGDKGLSATFEVTTPEFAEGFRGLAFIDAGWLGNNSPNAVRPSSDSIASVGLGLRFAKGNFLASADYGRIVAGSKVSTAANAAAPKKGDDKFYVNLSIRF
ncbi:MAG: ShlB/FhaC/HecB family hemolysin secretion/activation protein [Burkholderiales bacterium]|nr:ShlB/FhaC/HecB family hemolysin secretion/activation protein [Burkholderiales bacterium]